MVILALALALVGGFVIGVGVGASRANRRWLAALLDDAPVDYDTMLARILQQIQDEGAA